MIYESRISFCGSPQGQCMSPPSKQGLNHDENLVLPQGQEDGRSSFSRQGICHTENLPHRQEEGGELMGCKKIMMPRNCSHISGAEDDKNKDSAVTAMRNPLNREPVLAGSRLGSWVLQQD